MAGEDISARERDGVLTAVAACRCERTVVIVAVGQAVAFIVLSIAAVRLNEAVRVLCTVVVGAVDSPVVVVQGDDLQHEVPHFNMVDYRVLSRSADGTGATTEEDCRSMN